MTIDRKKLLIIGSAGVVVLALLIWLGTYLWHEYTYQEVSTQEPIDIVIDFYDAWHTAVGTSTSPYEAGLGKNPLLSRELRNTLAKGKNAPEDTMDPVMCRTKYPSEFATRMVSQTETAAEVVVTSRDKAEPEQSIFALEKLRDGWFIKDIRCSPGEFGPQREFSFDMSGYLLKNVPAPLDPKYWYIVFTENGQDGHYAPLFFDAASTCVLGAGEAVCDQGQLTETSHVHVLGQMTELGVQVKRLEVTKE